MKKIAVVFVHGFTGGNKTWENSGGMKFKDLLEENPNLHENFEFFEFEYYTKILDVFDSAPVQEILGFLKIPKFLGFKKKIRGNKPIRQISDSLSTFLRLKLKAYDEVVLVAHSMGGLITKDFILNHQKGDKPKPIGFVSIAVPHKGALSSLILAPIRNINSKELTPLNEYSDNLNNKWTDRRNNLPESIYLIAQHDQCVPLVSATPFTLKAAEKFFVEHDHVSICKPETKDDLSYDAVESFLNKVAHQANMIAATKISYADTSPDYNKEIFVIKLILCDIGDKGIDDAKESFFNAEIISKAADLEDKEILKELQSKVLSLYRQTYNQYATAGNLPNEIFTKVHSTLLDEDSKALSVSVRYINFLHKKGLLHQLANKLCTTVVWSDETSLADIMKLSK